MNVELIAELATAHGGDVALACDMVQAAADAGAHTVKIQSYTLQHLNPTDPQYDWLKNARLDEKAHERIRGACEEAGVEFLSTPFDLEALNILRRLGVNRIKVASTQPVPPTWTGFVVKSWPWGRRRRGACDRIFTANLTAIPLYPTPLEAVNTAPLLDGWSDHTIGTEVCQHMLSKGASIIEAHFCLPGKSRQMAWDKTPEQFRAIRDWADTVETLTTGVSQTFRERWSA